MAYAHTYTTLWHHQTYLFSEISSLRSRITYTERQLQRTQEILAREGLKRNERRKANWTVTTNRRHLKDLDMRLKTQMQGLLACQAQLGHMHIEASQGNFAGVGMQAQGSGSAYPSRQLSRDSGFWEPALYAQPFDLDLHQGDEGETYLFSHELMRPLPVVGTSVSLALDPTVAEFVPGVRQKSSGDVTMEVGSTPVSPMTRVPALELETQRRYSEAAISLIEGRLRKQKRYQKGRTSDKGQEAVDGDVDVAAESAKRQRESSEMKGLILA